MDLIQDFSVGFDLRSSIELFGSSLRREGATGYRCLVVWADLLKILFGLLASDVIGKSSNTRRSHCLASIKSTGQFGVYTEPWRLKHVKYTYCTGILHEIYLDSSRILIEQANH